jgi:hypothetical protein
MGAPSEEHVDVSSGLSGTGHPGVTVVAQDPLPHPVIGGPSGLGTDAVRGLRQGPMGRVFNPSHIDGRERRRSGRPTAAHRSYVGVRPDQILLGPCTASR